MKCVKYGDFFQCNNPLTKEPKLEAAVRIAPEWTGYDEEIKQLQDRFYEKKGSDVKPGIFIACSYPSIR